jgi:hypothetical protein
MCKRVTCPKCQKPSFVGCGLHVEQVLGDVPPEERCRCRETAEARPSGQASVLRRLFRL